MRISRLDWLTYRIWATMSAPCCGLNHARFDQLTQNMTTSRPMLASTFEPQLAETRPCLTESGPILIDPGPMLVVSEPRLVDTKPSLANFGPNVVDLGPIWVEFGQFRATLGQHGANFVKFRAEVRRAQDNFGPPRALSQDSVRSWSPICPPDLVELGQCCSTPAHVFPNSAQIWSTTARNRHTSAKFGSIRKFSRIWSTPDHIWLLVVQIGPTSFPHSSRCSQPKRATTELRCGPSARRDALRASNLRSTKPKSSGLNRPPDRADSTRKTWAQRGRARDRRPRVTSMMRGRCNEPGRAAHRRASRSTEVSPTVTTGVTGRQFFPPSPGRPESRERRCVPAPRNVRSFGRAGHRTHTPTPTLGDSTIGF